ncbi:MAG TPA: 4Fe-4S dicluster domain-containing protein [Methanotrichaceae archaeon]|nr:4Fe-4S dicluster domain-containing protein [Methanotrichaceae archaeon]
MAAAVNKEERVNCETCVDECSQEAINVGDYEIAVIDADKCTECGSSIEVCPSEATSPEG